MMQDTSKFKACNKALISAARIQNVYPRETINYIQQYPNTRRYVSKILLQVWVAHGLLTYSKPKCWALTYLTQQATCIVVVCSIKKTCFLYLSITCRLTNSLAQLSRAFVWKREFPNKEKSSGTTNPKEKNFNLVLDK